MRAYLLLLIVLFAVSSSLVAAETYCVLPSGTCALESAHSTTPPTFPNWCAAQGGTYSTTITPACQLVCCCKAGESAAYEDLPTSMQRCQQYGEFSAKIPPADNNCAIACGGSSGTVGSTATIVATVLNDGTKDANGVSVPLPEAKIEYPLGSRLVTFYTDARGKVTLPNVPTGLFVFKASKIGCGEEQLQVNVQTSTSIEFKLNCATGGCTPAPVNTTTAKPVVGKPQVDVTWLPPTCTNIVGYKIYRCAGSKTTGECATGAILTPVGFVPKGTATFTDNLIPLPATDVCYRVKIMLADGHSTEIDAALPADKKKDACVYAMNPYCTQNAATTSRCFNKDVELKPIGADGTEISSFTGKARCDANNRVDIETECTAGQYCSAASSSCVASANCEKCNGPFGLFIDPMAIVTGSTRCNALSGCFLDNTGYITDTFTSCEGISSCYDYRSPVACGTPANPDKCRLSGGCEWKSITGQEELGKGVCVPKVALANAPCETCDDIFGFPCGAQDCALLGDTCYFKEEADEAIDGSQAGCRAKADMACRYYNDQTDCVKHSSASATSVVVDAQYNASGSRIGGTNNITIKSKDRFGFGTCAWVADADHSNDGYCVKNANGNLATLESGEQDDDCFESDSSTAGMAACFKDNAPPATTLPFAPGEFIGLDRLRAAVPIVRDDTFTPDAIATYACLVLKGGTCYPNVPFANLNLKGRVKGVYTLYYYSADPAGNLETTKSIDLNVDEGLDPYIVKATIIG